LQINAYHSCDAYRQLYRRIGFTKPYPPLSRDEMDLILTKHWRKLGRNFDADDFSNAQAAATITRLTGGNFRLLQRLFNQIDRILHIKELREITEDVIQAAASTLVIGTAH
jgi:DNA transposition AAA+ family ATPase